MENTILGFYKSYCTEFDLDSKTDSILSKYCTEELKDYVMECVGEYDFVLGGRFESEIDTESFRVVKRNEKYLVSFEYAKWPVSDEPGKDSLYVMVNKDDKISYIIRPSDNYRIPNPYGGKYLDLYSFYDYVDLGLSVNWATYNIGSNSVTPYWWGKHYAWGETVTKYDFRKDNHFAARQSVYFNDGVSVLEPCDDAATVLWGPDWRMPTKEEFQELVESCDWEWIEVDGDEPGYNGYKVTGKNGNSIFLPAGGMKIDTRWLYYEDNLYYWTSTCKADDPVREPKAWMFCSVSEGPDKNKIRSLVVVPTPLSVQVGRNIRPVTARPYVPIRDIELDKSKLKLEIGDEYILTASFIPSDATKKDIRWKSGNSAVACVDRNGKVTAVSKGKCTITAVCGEFRKECQVTVLMPKDYIAEPENVTTIYEFGKEVDTAFVDDFQDFDVSEEMKEVFSTHIGDNSDGFTVTLSDFTSESCDMYPDYCLITIKTAGGQYRFKNGDWVSNDIFENSYFYCQRIDKSKYLLFFRGFDYGCCPGILTVIAVDETGARVVYNKECYLTEINREPFSMTTDSWGAEYVSRYETNYSPDYNLYIEDNALKLKRVELLHDY